MSKASDKELGELHGTVAKVLRQKLEDEFTVTDEEGNTQVVNASDPATINAAIKFLKDNNVTASIEDDDNLQSLEEMLAKKKEKRGKGLRLVSGEDG